MRTSANNYARKMLYASVHKLLAKLTRYVGNVLFASINIVDNEWVKQNGVKIFDIFKPENSACINLMNDIDLLNANAKTAQYIIDMPNEEQASKKLKGLLNDLDNNTVRKFCLLHKEYQFNESEIVALKVYKEALINGSVESKEVLLAKVKSTLFSKMNPWDGFVDEIMADLKSLTLERFVKKYPAFKESNCSSSEVIALKNASFSAKTNLPEQAKMQMARTCVFNKIHAIYPFARAALFSHVLAYNNDFYSLSKNEVKFRLPLENGKGANFVVKPIIHDEQGLAITLFSPLEEPETETIPLVFMCEGSHDLFSLLRDLQPKGAGMEEFFSQKPYLHRIFYALNQEIESLAIKYPHKKVSIEIFGHSLGGADVYELLLAFQEAMAQNKLRNPEGTKDFEELMDANNSKGFLNAKNPELRSALPQALKESLGFEKRDFGHGYIDERIFSSESISAINGDRIANIKAYPKNGAGVHHKILSGIAATAAFLGKNGDYKLYDNPLDLSGDAVQRTGHGRGLYMASPHESFFDEVIKLSHCKFNTLKEGFINQARLLAEGRLAPIEVHQEKIFDQGPMSWFQKDVKITRNDSLKNMKNLRNELYNPVTIDGKNALVDIRAYVKVKSMIYFLLNMITTILLPIIEQSRKWLAHADTKLSDAVGIISPKQDTKDNVVLNKTRNDLMDKQTDLLLTPMHANKKLRPYLASKPALPSQKSKENHSHYQARKSIKI